MSAYFAVAQCKTCSYYSYAVERKEEHAELERELFGLEPVSSGRLDWVYSGAGGWTRGMPPHFFQEPRKKARSLVHHLCVCVCGCPVYLFSLSLSLSLSL